MAGTPRPRTVGEQLAPQAAAFIAGVLGGAQPPGVFHVTEVYADQTTVSVTINGLPFTLQVEAS